MHHGNRNNFCQTKLELPYPEIRVAGCNPDYALEILSNVGSCNSEMSAVSLYFYNSVILDQSYRSFAHCFIDISIVEMHHLDMFAKVAFLLGANPRLWTMERNQMVYWTPACNNYPHEIKEVICNSIQGEEEAIRKYRKQAQTIRDPYIVALLERIILDEEHHIEIFHYMLDQVT